MEGDLTVAGFVVGCDFNPVFIVLTLLIVVCLRLCVCVRMEGLCVCVCVCVCALSVRHCRGEALVSFHGE